jgi:hypothetical protein
MKIYRGVEIWLHAVLTLALVGGEWWSASHPQPIYPQYPFNKFGGPQGSLLQIKYIFVGHIS